MKALITFKLRDFIHNCREALQEALLEDFTIDANTLDWIDLASGEGQRHRAPAGN